MFRALYTRIKQGHRTMAYPEKPVPLPERFRGFPAFDGNGTGACPYGAVAGGEDPFVDLGKCLFCAECPAGITFTAEPRLAASTRAELLVRPGGKPPLPRPLRDDLHRLFGRSLKFREVSAGGCNACEADTNVLATVGWDLGRFGIQFVASPRHADGLWVTGPVTENMREALLKTYDAIPDPRIVVACGACAINGGPFLDLPDVGNGVDRLIPVDLYIPGCPPHPVTILDGLLRTLGKL